MGPVNPTLSSNNHPNIKTLHDRARIQNEMRNYLSMSLTGMSRRGGMRRDDAVPSSNHAKGMF
jgi:hypothetical protein